MDPLPFSPAQPSPQDPPVEPSAGPTGLDAVAQACLADLLAGRHACVIGAPGTGKSTVVGSLFAGLLAAAHNPDEVLVLTPNRDAAAALRDTLGPAPVAAPGACAPAPRTGPAARSVHSFAFGLVSAQAAVRDGSAMKFISGPDQDNLLAGLLAGYDSGLSRPPAWPERFTPEVRGTTAFRNQLREVLNELMGRGFTPDAVEQAALTHGRPEWDCVARIMQDYEDLLAVPGFGGVDTAEVFEQARWVLQDQAEAGVRAGSAPTFSAEILPRTIVIDGGQDVPDAALRMLTTLAALGVRLCLLASPDSASQGFRGAGGDLLDAFTRPGNPFHTVPHVLDEAAAGVRGAGGVRTVGDDLARRVSTRLELGHIPRRAGMLPGGDSRVYTATAESSAELGRIVAARLRSWQRDEGVEWTEMAVLTRTSGTARALEADLGYLGIPVAGADLALGVDPATAPLLRILRADRSDPGALDAVITELLTGVYAGLDAIALRGLNRELLAALARLGDQPLVESELPDSGAAEADPAPVEDPLRPGAPTAPIRAEPLLVRALRELPEAELPAPLRQVDRMLRAAAKHRGHDPHTALWAIWRAARVDRAWRAAALRDPADAAHDRLDAVLRLMTLAEKFSERGALDARGFADDVLEQRFAQDSLAKRAEADHVAVAAAAQVAHTDFSRVVVVDLEDGVWPNPRVRGSIFSAEDLLDVLRGIAPEQAAEQAYRARRRATIADEARLALCAFSRAREELVLLAVDDGDAQPGVFFRTAQAALARHREAGGDLPRGPRDSGTDAAENDAAENDAAENDPAGQSTAGAEPDGVTEEPQVGAPAATGDPGWATAQPIAWDPAWSEPLTLMETAALARYAFEAAATGQEEGRWAVLLKSLAAAGVADADPAGWLDWQELSRRDPLLEPGQIARISPSTVELFHTCGLRWLLTRHGGQSSDTRAQHLGTIIHAIAEEFPRGGLLHMRESFDRRFAELDYPSEWERDREYATGLEMLDHLQDYISGRAPDGYTLVGVEGAVSAEDTRDSEDGPWVIRGRIDRLEKDSAGRLYVVDFKTGKRKPTVAEARVNPQLATYQAALDTPGHRVTFTDEGAQADLDSAVPGGGELVFLRYSDTLSRGVPANVRPQPALADTDDPGWAGALVAATARGMRSPVFTASPSRQTCAGCPVRSSCPAYAGGEDE
ncbi:PD-(D/E)XK nuclease family protein [Brevibacterium sp. 91QC2O2]|uniref:PD-(D/E)XK nuclease family protein n=1 Tax=Brevibacterium sp. 91QC2O2 TaxID=2968458 RepID=UPI00211D0468|nr:PD-(D/E)XK nuclease family protein [Brevibacterium sp. 91QC2O2]MCQ9368433.1 PD-(D/E)XK nuclease family protein [Brevibacterium sp. 91QC2O2]